MANPEVVALAKKASRGSKKSFDELCRGKVKEIIFSALTITGNLHDAEDAAQETLFDMHRYIGRLRHPEAIDTWIQRIVKSKCVEIINRRGSQAGERDIDIDDETVQIPDDDKDFLPAAYAENEEMSDQLYEIILGLPEKRREVILMYYYKDMSYKEIASVTGTSMGTVATNLQRARMTIREQLEETRILETANRRDTPDRRNESERRDGSERRKASLSANVSATALGLVMRQQAEKRVPEGAIIAVERKFAAKILGMQFPAAQAFITKAIISAVIATITVVGVVSTVVSYPDVGHAEEVADITETSAAGTLTDILQGRKIAFSGSDCDCGHLNPDGVALTHLKKGDAVTGWRIEDSASRNILSRGNGADAGRALVELEETNHNGEYRFIFTLTDAQGNVIDINRRFTLGHKIGDEVF
jgi:RNA polymerase sigma-70 factor (ECF subfamily)